MIAEGNLYYDDLFVRLQTYFNGEGLAYLIAPFIRADVLAALLGERDAQPTLLLTSWRPDHVLAGASDLDVYPLCRERGWDLYVSDRLHAKFYSLNLTTAWIGSANVTRRALGLADTSNDEVLCLADPLPTDARAWVYRLLHGARLVTDELHAHYVAWLAGQVPPSPPSALPAMPLADRDPFSVDELPATASPQRLWDVLQAPAEATAAERAAAEHDVGVYRVHCGGMAYDVFCVQLAAAFRAHPFVAALLEAVDGRVGPEYAERPGMQFGVVKQWVRGRCTDEASPSMQSLTEGVTRLFTWCDDLLASDYRVYLPGAYSQVICRRDFIS